MREPLNTPNADGPRLLTVKDTCDRLAIGRRLLWSLTTSNAVPHLRIGRAVRFRIDELTAWVDAGCPTDAGAAKRIRDTMRGGRQ